MTLETLFFPTHMSEYRWVDHGKSYQPLVSMYMISREAEIWFGYSVITQKDQRVTDCCGIISNAAVNSSCCSIILQTVQLKFKCGIINVLQGNAYYITCRVLNLPNAWTKKVNTSSSRRTACVNVLLWHSWEWVPLLLLKGVDPDTSLYWKWSF